MLFLLCLTRRPIFGIVRKIRRRNWLKDGLVRLNFYSPRPVVPKLIIWLSGSRLAKLELSIYKNVNNPIKSAHIPAESVQWTAITPT